LPGTGVGRQFVMQMARRTSENESPGFQELIKQSAQEITRRWVEAVRADRSIPSAEELEEPLLLDAVPLVLEEILRVVEIDGHEIEHERICSAARHGRERALEHFDVRELVREYQLLREIIFLHVRSQAKQFARFGMGDSATIFLRIGAALDEAMRETINAFVEEHMLQLQRLSRTDGLTGLYNHRTFYERLAEELNRAKRYDSPLTIVLVDLDNFKAVNDLKGHPFGDHILVKCAERLRESLRQTDIICRYGGDEFGLILTETTRDHAETMMRRLSRDFTELGKREAAAPHFGMSFGLSAHPEDEGTVRSLVKAADDRLITNKRTRKVSLVLA
ncbi:MAG: diguanylate cyclase, partial [Acidobacteria bacterium]|nr:diguanylate cyclase [Acidobacteriota bacterium]